VSQVPEVESELSRLRERLDAINHALLNLLNERARLVQQVREVKVRHGVEMYSPGRESEMIEDLVAANQGPFPEETIRTLFREIFRACLGLMERADGQPLRVRRGPGRDDVVVHVRGRAIGLAPVVIAGPCSIEDPEQMEAVAEHLKRLGVQFLRGGAFKPRTSPYSFQGLGARGLEILNAIGREFDLVTVTEVLDTRTVDLVAEHCDILQIGSRNMANYELLKAAAATGRPVLLKRGFGATLDEFLQAAEYLAAAGNESVILCERGIRSFGRETRFTLDISAVPLLRRMARLPVIVDVSHAAGRRDILDSLARAALAAGAHGVMVEVHPDPHRARSDAEQQLDLRGFEAFLSAIAVFLGRAS